MNHTVNWGKYFNIKGRKFYMHSASLKVFNSHRKRESLGVLGCNLKLILECIQSWGYKIHGSKSIMHYQS